MRCNCRPEVLSSEVLQQRATSFMWGDIIGWSLQMSYSPSTIRQVEQAILATKEGNSSNFCFGIVCGLNRLNPPEYSLRELEMRAA